MNRYLLIQICLCVFLLTGCVPDVLKHTPYINESLPFNATTASQDQNRLFAAERFVHSGEIAAAKSYLDSISPSALSATQRNKLNLLYAQIYLSDGEAEKALDRLSITQPYNLKQADQIAYYQSLAFAYSLTGNLLQAVQSRIQLNPLLNSEEQRSENSTVILNTLSLLPTETLRSKQPPAPDILGGWMALTRLIKTRKQNQEPTDFKNSLQQWAYFFPQHPANTDFLNKYFDSVNNHFTLPAAIALFLPETGRFAKAAQVIKKGFMEANQYSDPSFQPSIRFYDSSSSNISSLYRQALAEGAELVIGPLGKDNIQELALSTELSTPVLALNHIPDLVVENLYQFGLSPIDEANQVSSAAALDGHTNALLLVPETNQGNRIANFLAESWDENGGTLLESQSYKSRSTDFSLPIKKLLNLDESKYRYKRLKKVLSRNIGYVERRRQDVDVILLSANAKTARSIYPQLRFYHASRVPVYAMPDIYQGRANPSLDIDLNNIAFCDIPWLFPEAYPSELNQQATVSSWQHLPRRYIRLFALGIDAFNVIPHLGQLHSIPYNGATGILSTNYEKRITRQLVCAKFVNGAPVLQEFDEQ